MVLAPVCIEHQKAAGLGGPWFGSGFLRSVLPAPNDHISAALLYFMWLSRRRNFACMLTDV